MVEHAFESRIKEINLTDESTDCGEESSTMLGRVTDEESTTSTNNKPPPAPKTFLSGQQDDKFYVIPRQALITILNENQRCQQRANEVGEQIARSLELLTENVFDAMSEAKDDMCNRIVSKLDDLIVSFEQNKSSPTIQNEIDGIDDELQARFQLMEQIIQCDKMSSYYKELLHGEIPYAPRKFRVKVNKDASEIELKHRRQQAIDAVTTEINIMEERVVYFRKQLKSLDKSIEEYVGQNEIKRAVIIDKIERNDKRMAEEFENAYLAKRRNAYKKCKENCTEFLLIFVDDKSPRDGAINQWNHQYQQLTSHGLGRSLKNII